MLCALQNTVVLSVAKWMASTDAVHGKACVAYLAAVLSQDQSVNHLALTFR